MNKVFVIFLLMKVIIVRFEVTKEKDDVNAFPVCLVDVPAFPVDPGNISDVVRTPLLAVVGAVLGDDGWSFANFSKDEKHAIGDLMLEKGASVGEWLWCKQFKI